MADIEVFQTTGIATPRVVCEIKMAKAKNCPVISRVIPLSEAYLLNR